MGLGRGTRGSWKKVLALTLLALLAGGATAALLARSGTRYETVGSYSVPPSARGVSEVSQYVSNFEAAADIGSVLDEVESGCELSREDVEAGIQVDQEGKSNIVNVRFSYDQDLPDLGECVVKTLVAGATRFLAEPAAIEAKARVVSARRYVEAVQTAVEEAEKAYSRSRDAVGPVPVQQLISSTYSGLASLRSQLSAAEAAGDAVAAGMLEASIAAAEADLQRLGDALDEQTELERAVAGSHDMLADARRDLRAAQAAVADSASTVRVEISVRSRELELWSSVVRRAVAVAAATFIAGLALIMGFFSIPPDPSGAPPRAD